MSMKKSWTLATFALALSMGCGDEADLVRAPLDNVQQKGVCLNCSYWNGQGVYVTMASTNSRFGMATDYTGWHLLGFVNLSNPSRVEAHFKKIDGSGIESDAQTPVISVKQGSATYDLVKVDAADANLGPSNVRLDLRNRSNGQLVSMSESGLANLTVQLSFPSGGPSGPHSVRFQPADDVDPSSRSLNGYELEFKNDSVAGDPWRAVCNDGDGASQHAVFLAGVRIHPKTAQRTVDATYTNLSCASGTIAACMIWGYRPWDTSGDYHQACMQMKRAAYCGATPYTNYGNAISVRDSSSPRVNDQASPVSEAYWGVNGALCLDSRRETSIAFPGCAAPLPSCSTVPAGWLTRSTF